MQDIFEILKNSKLLRSREALADFTDFEVERSAETVLCDELLSVYQGRAEHLQDYKTEHAIQLRQSTLEFCSNLKQNLGKKCYFYTMKGKPKQEYLLVFKCEDLELLGCLRIISKLKATEEEWSLAWGH
ncbi:hypothetical protein EYS14_03865 [Alteromonadaceae bacterium M269]|nr:hypothetical protein EYS14_03865 [Alteromonadaceae bacterium M269]